MTQAKEVYAKLKLDISEKEQQKDALTREFLRIEVLRRNLEAKVDVLVKRIIPVASPLLPEIFGEAANLLAAEKLNYSELRDGLKAAMVSNDEATDAFALTRKEHLAFTENTQNALSQDRDQISEKSRVEHLEHSLKIDESTADRLIDEASAIERLLKKRTIVYAVMNNTYGEPGHDARHFALAAFGKFSQWLKTTAFYQNSVTSFEAARIASRNTLSKIEIDRQELVNLGISIGKREEMTRLAILDHMGETNLARYKMVETTSVVSQKQKALDESSNRLDDLTLWRHPVSIKAHQQFTALLVNPEDPSNQMLDKSFKGKVDITEDLLKARHGLSKAAAMALELNKLKEESRNISIHIDGLEKIASKMRSKRLNNSSKQVNNVDTFMNSSDGSIFDATGLMAISVLLDTAITDVSDNSSSSSSDWSSSSSSSSMD